jgi:prephenate dehydratase
VIPVGADGLGSGRAELASAYMSRGSAARNGHSGLHAYLGPEGTFAESALRAVVPGGVGRVPKPSITAALDAVRNGTVADATVPWENSTAGTVAETIRGLAHGEPLIIRREVIMPVKLVLAAPSGIALPDVVRILSHPHALAQAERWLAEVSPTAARVSAQSTARAAEAVSQARGTTGDAAVCSEPTAGIYGLKIIARPSAGAAPATTRFVVVGKMRPHASPPAAASDAAGEPITTTLLLRLPAGCRPEDAKAALKGARLGDYRIDRDVTDLAGGRRCMCVHISGEPSLSVLQRVATGLRRRGIRIRHLGGYGSVNPTAPGSRVQAPG